MAAILSRCIYPSSCSWLHLAHHLGAGQRCSDVQCGVQAHQAQIRRNPWVRAVRAPSGPQRCDGWYALRAQNTRDVQGERCNDRIARGETPVKPPMVRVLCAEWCVILTPGLCPEQSHPGVIF